jgi:hypothetical protein
MKYPNSAIEPPTNLSIEQLTSLQNSRIKASKNVLIYVLCFHDESEEIAREDFGSFSWARIYRLKKQTELFEGIMYKDELLELYDEWKDVDYVGTISYSYLRKFPKNKEYLLNKLGNLDRNFHGLIHSLSNPMYHNEKMKDYMILLIERVNLKPSKSWFFCNYWCCKPSIMKAYITWFNNVWLPNLYSIEALWEDPHYKPSLHCIKSETKIRYTYHPFLTERIVSPYFDYYS